MHWGAILAKFGALWIAVIFSVLPLAKRPAPVARPNVQSATCRAVMQQFPNWHASALQRANRRFPDHAWSRADEVAATEAKRIKSWAKQHGVPPQEVSLCIALSLSHQTERNDSLRSLPALDPRRGG